jgi:hypothetical protein
VNNPPRQWIPQTKCCMPDCGMTLCTPAGQGSFVCWLHAILLGMPLVDQTPPRR